MSNIPETEKQQNDFIDFLIESSKKVHEVEGVDGRPEKISLIDAKSIKYQTRNINSPTFGRFVFLLEEFGGMAIDAFNHMSKERANTLGNQIMRKIESYGYSIDAKSSEMVQDSQNNQKNLIAIMTKNEIVKKYKLSGEMKKSIVAGWFGKNEEPQE